MLILIQGYRFPNKYIATQGMNDNCYKSSFIDSHTGPLSKTLTDFWRLVWQERAPTIVMVTNLKDNDKVKCQQYWPDKGSQHYGPFVVTNTDKQLYTDYTIRQMQVEVSELFNLICEFDKYLQNS